MYHTRYTGMTRVFNNSTAVLKKTSEILGMFFRRPPKMIV